MTAPETSHRDADFDLQRAILKAWSLDSWQDVTVLLAVSGGPDSVALLRAMVALKRQSSGRLVVAHFNHQTRGAASDEDERFVTDLSRRLGVRCEVGHPAEGSERARDEQSWRADRYRFLEDVASQMGARYVVTAHTADDQAETILHRILRGTGLGGLTGIPRIRLLGHATLMRPMLGVRREQLLAYLSAREQSYRSDASNDELQFTRNRIRHELLPRLVRDYNPQAVEALLRQGILAHEASDVLQGIVEKLWQQCAATRATGDVEIDCERLRDEPPYLIREVFLRAYRTCQWPMQAMGHAQWKTLEEMVRSTESDPPSITLPGAIHVSREGQRLTLRQMKQRGKKSACSSTDSL